MFWNICLYLIMHPVASPRRVFLFCGHLCSFKSNGLYSGSWGLLQIFCSEFFSRRFASLCVLAILSTIGASGCNLASVFPFTLLSTLGFEFTVLLFGLVLWLLSLCCVEVHAHESILHFLVWSWPCYVPFGMSLLIFCIVAVSVSISSSSSRVWFSLWCSCFTTCCASL